MDNNKGSLSPSSVTEMPEKGNWKQDEIRNRHGQQSNFVIENSVMVTIIKGGTF